MHSFLHLRASHAELGMARELLGRFSYPMLLVDEARGISYQNAQAGALLASGDFLVDQGGFLTCVERSSDNALTEAIHSLQLSATDQMRGATRRVVVLRGRDGQNYLAFVSAVRPELAMGVFGSAARALIVLHDPLQPIPAPDPFIIAECFDLTPAEARVAADIAGGMNAKEIAQRQGAALPTVRSHIQRVMDKVGVARQVDLVRVLLALPVGPGQIPILSRGGSGSATS